MLKALISTARANGQKVKPIRLYNNFELNVYSEEIYSVTESEYDEVTQMMAEENEALANMPQDKQTAWERKQNRLKNWLGGYSPITDGDTYNGIAI